MMYKVNKGCFWAMVHLRIRLVFTEYAIKYVVFDWKLDVFESGHFSWIGVDQYPVLFPNYLKRPNIPLFLVLEVLNIKLAYRKSCLANLLLILDLTLGASFKVKGGFISFKGSKLTAYQIHRFGMFNQSLFMECRFLNWTKHINFKV